MNGPAAENIEKAFLPVYFRLDPFDPIGTRVLRRRCVAQFSATQENRGEGIVKRDTMLGSACRGIRALGLGIALGAMVLSPYGEAEASPSPGDLVDSAEQDYDYACTVTAGLPRMPPNVCDYPDFVRESLQRTFGSVASMLEHMLDRMDEIATELDEDNPEAAALVRQRAFKIGQLLLRVNRRIDDLSCQPDTQEAVSCQKLGSSTWLCTCGGCEGGASCGKCDELDSAGDCNYKPIDQDYLCDSDHTPPKSPPPG